jgi:hypothetical protein
MLLADEVIKAGTVLQLDLSQALALSGSILLGLPTAAYFIGKALATAFVGYLGKKDELDRTAATQRDNQTNALTEQVRALTEAATARTDSDFKKDEKMRELFATMETTRRAEDRQLVQSFVDLNKEAIGAIVAMRTDVGGVSQQVTALGGELGRFGTVVDRLAKTMDHLSDQVERNSREPSERGGRRRTQTPGEPGGPS